MASTLPLPLLQALPPLTSLSLLPLALAFLALALLYPRPASTNTERFSLILPAEEKDRLAVPSSGLRPSSYASRHTTVRAPDVTGVPRAGLNIAAPAVVAGIAFGASAVCQIAAVAKQESDASGLSRSSVLLSTVGVFFAGLTPILLLTRQSLTHIFPSCATLQPTRRVSSGAPTPVEPPILRKRASYRVGLLFLALLVASLYTLLTSALAPTVAIPSSALAVGPALEMLALLLPLPSILHLSPHRPILLPLLIAHFFGLVSRSLSIAHTFEPAGTPIKSGLDIAAAGCTLLWVSTLLVCTSVLAATPQKSSSPIPALYPSPAQLALLHASLERPAPSPLGVGLRPDASSNPSTNASVIDIAAPSVSSSDSSEQKESELPGYTQNAPAVELHDPTALLRAALLRAMESPSQASAFESIRSTLPADFTLGLHGSPALHGAAGWPVPPVPIGPAAAGTNVTPPRPRTAGGAVQTLRHAVSRLVKTPTRPRTAPSQRTAQEPDCSTLPSSRLTPPQQFGFNPSPAAAGEMGQSWLTDLEASPTGQIVPLSLGRREKKKSLAAEGVMVEVETESDAYETPDEGARK